MRDVSTLWRSTLRSWSPGAIMPLFRAGPSASSWTKSPFLPRLLVWLSTRPTPTTGELLGLPRWRAGSVSTHGPQGRGGRCAAGHARGRGSGRDPLAAPLRRLAAASLHVRHPLLPPSRAPLGLLWVVRHAARKRAPAAAEEAGHVFSQRARLVPELILRRPVAPVVRHARRRCPWSSSKPGGSERT